MYLVSSRHALVYAQSIKDRCLVETENVDYIWVINGFIAY